MKRLTKRTLPFVASLAALVFAGCSGTSDDPHAAPRDTKAWEQVDVSSMGQDQLLAHFSLLADETARAAAAGEAIEFHHLEVAMTATLVALEGKAPGNEAALQTIATLKPLAIKLHLAGHDGNVAMGVKLSKTFTELSARLATEF